MPPSSDRQGSTRATRDGVMANWVIPLCMLDSLRGVAWGRGRRVEKCGRQGEGGYASGTIKSSNLAGRKFCERKRPGRALINVGLLFSASACEKRDHSDVTSRQEIGDTHHLSGGGGGWGLGRSMWRRVRGGPPDRRVVALKQHLLRRFSPTRAATDHSPKEVVLS